VEGKADVSKLCCWKGHGENEETKQKKEPLRQAGKDHICLLDMLMGKMKLIHMKEGAFVSLK
jgi:hypothetical protein